VTVRTPIRPCRENRTEREKVLRMVEVRLFSSFLCIIVHASC
jgi:hypothetical protein